MDFCKGKFGYKLFILGGGLEVKSLALRTYYFLFFSTYSFSKRLFSIRTA